jgi:hypothetical protein
MSITNTATPSEPVGFETLLSKMMPHFKFFAKNVQRLKADNFDDAIQDLTAIAFDLYASLVRRGKEVFYSPIMKYAIQRYKSGRYFTGTSSKCILADQTKILGRSEVCSLSQFGVEDNSLHFMIDPRMDVVGAVRIKLDFFEGWLRQQCPQDREIIRDLALGSTQSEVAKKHGLNSGSVAWLRKKYARSWDAYISD